LIQLRPLGYMALNGLVAYFPAFCHKKQEKCYPIRGVIDIVAER